MGNCDGFNIAFTLLFNQVLCLYYGLRKLLVRVRLGIREEMKTIPPCKVVTDRVTIRITIMRIFNIGGL